jgi:L-aspartate oxidase
MAGSGIAGLFSAIKCANAGWDVCVITKQTLEESSTNYAQGGIAGILDKTNQEGKDIHIKDTLDAGDGYCDEDVVRAVVNEAGDRIRDLIEVGVNFHTNSSGEFDFIKEGGHSQKIILHSKDSTGKEIEDSLLKKAKEHPRIKLLSNHLALDLIVDDDKSSNNQVLGLWVFNIEKGIVESFYSDSVILATGGGGQLFSRTTNPGVSTADGMAMALRAGAKLKDMEFVQFHPTSAALKSDRTFLISEAVRGFGAVLMTSSDYKKWKIMKEKNIQDSKKPPMPNDYSFTQNYSSSGSLATRDVVARAIDNELNISGEEYVYLVTEHLDSEILKDRFPLIEKFLNKYDLFLGQDPIPVVPAAHYTCGGVTVDLNGLTDLPNLYAIGEVSSTGLHGANRLASNSLLECLVFAKRCSEHIKRKGISQVDQGFIPHWDESKVIDSQESVVIAHNWEELRRFMWDYVGIVRTDKRLNQAMHRIQLLKEEIRDFYGHYKISNDLIELRNLVDVAELIVSSALKRKESRGLHYNTDHLDELSETRDTILKP